MLSKISSKAIYAATHVKQMLDEKIQAHHKNLTFAYPDDDVCMVYAEQNFGGRPYYIGLYGADFVDIDLRNKGYYFPPQSWYCGKDVRYQFCDNLYACEGAIGSSGIGAIMNPVYN